MYNTIGTFLHWYSVIWDELKWHVSLLKALKGFGSSCIKLSSLNYLNVLMGTTGVFNRFKIFGNHVNRHKNEGKLLLKCYRSRYRLYIFNILVCELNCLGPRSESWMNCVVVRSQLGTDWSVSLSIVRLYAVKFFLFYEWPLIFIQNCTSVNKCFLSNIQYLSFESSRH